MVNWIDSCPLQVQAKRNRFPTFPIDSTLPSYSTIMWAKRTTFFLRGEERELEGGGGSPSRPPRGETLPVLGRLLGWDLLELFFRVHLGLGGVEDGLLGDDASLDLRT